MPSGWCRRLFTTAIPCSSRSRSSNISTIFSPTRGSCLRMQRTAPMPAPWRQPPAKMFGADVHAIESWGKHWTTEGLATYERLLARRPPAPFVLGVQPRLADICIACQVVGAHFLKLELSAFPAVSRLADRCFEMAAFAASHPFEQPGFKTAGAH